MTVELGSKNDILTTNLNKLKIDNQLEL